MPEGSPETRAGESKLVAFVSSVMRPELEWAREAVVSALSDNPILIPWAFEFTPASSQGAVETYLAKVRGADVVIWLVGDETTAPVRNEIAEALAAGKRLWVFRLPATSRDEVTEQLIDEVGARAKWADADDASELRKLLALTFSDEVIRALRDKPALTRFALLEQLGRASRARMIVRWQGAGLPEAEAIAFADDLSVGAVSPELVPTAAQPFRIIMGDVGAGKSVVAERLIQQAIRESRDRASAPIPVFLRARDACSGLDAALLVAANQLGDPRQQGVYAVIDGADEIDQSDAAYLVESCRVLVQTFPSSRVVLTSRPVPTLRLEETVDLRLLDEEQAREIVGRVAGYEITIGAAGGWPSSLADAVRRPLFAILLGLNRRIDRGAPPTTGALLAALVEKAISSSRAADGLPWLERLAVASTDRGDAPVHVSEVGDLAARAAVIQSRLVQIDGDEVRFTLPILTQWFAAQSLQSGVPDVQDLLGTPRRLDRWRYALAIAVATGPRSFVNATLDALVRADPGFAAQVVEESLSRWAADVPPPGALPNWLEAGRELRAALTAWGDGIEPVSDELLPRRGDGGLAPLAIAAAEGWLTYGWYRGEDAETTTASASSEGVIELPNHVHILGGPYPDWDVRRGGQWANEPGWAWRWALEDLRSDLGRLLSRRALRSGNQDLIDEALWVLALKVAERGSLSPDPVPLVDGARALANAPREAMIKLHDRYAYIDQLQDRLEALGARGESAISSPWPGPDLEGSGGGWIWDPYSPERQRERVEAVYAAALRAYDDIVNQWFPELASRMLTAVMLPAILRGTFQPSSASQSECPTLTWHLEPLPHGDATGVEILIGDVPAREREDYERDHGRLLQARPESAGWISTIYHHELADVFQGAPLAELVYDWIKQDLRRTAWAG